MEDNTTTDAPAENGIAGVVNGVPIDSEGRAVPGVQPEEAEQAEAVTETTETPEQQAEAPESQESEAPTEPSTDDELKVWAEKKGLTLDSENSIKLANMARNAEKAMHAKAQKASQLEKAIDDGITQEVQTQGLSETEQVQLARIQTRMNVRDFFDANPEAKPYEAKMIELLPNNPHLVGDLEGLYAKALMSSGSIEAVKSQGKQEALQNLAHKQQAAVPTGNAVSSQGGSQTKITPQNVDAMVAQMSVEEYRQRQAEINAALAG